MARRSSNRKSTGSKSRRRHTKRNRILILLALLVVAYAVLWFVTPSVEEYYGDGGQTGVVAALEIPLLEDGDELIVHTGFSLVYDEEHEQATWVAYELTRDEVYGIHERADNFRADPSIRTGSASLDDYRGSGYDRGHLIPAADLPWSEQAMSDSFYMSNMSPQEPSFNRGIWASLEAVVRNFAATEGSVYVVTGPVLTDGPYETIGDNEVSIPNYYYKVVLDYVEPELKAIGFILPNEGSRADLTEFAVSVNDVEEMTGIDFFPQLPPDHEEELESSYDVSLWNFDEFRATKAERAAYSQDSTSVQIPQREDNTVAMVKSVIERIMVETKREVRSLVRSLDIPLVSSLSF
jgi:endonuclease G